MAGNKVVAQFEGPTDLMEAGAMIIALDTALLNAFEEIASLRGGYSLEWIEPMHSAAIKATKGTEFPIETLPDADAKATRKALALVDGAFARLRHRAQKA